MKTLSEIEVLYKNLSPERQHKIWDLALCAVNTGELYRSKFLGIQNSLYKKYLKNEYVEQQAIKAFYNTISAILKMWERGFDEKVRLTEAEKQILASEICEHYVRDFELYPNGEMLAV